MQRFDSRTLKTTVETTMRCYAMTGVYDAIPSTSLALYLERCTAIHLGRDLATQLIFTRDTNHHLSGWWKNPDYERCWHLSLRFCSPVGFAPVSKSASLTREWLSVFFGEERRKLWCEPPASPEGRKLDVWHYRLFCDANWQPIMPRKEVYSREFTEAGWQSFSDVEWLKTQQSVKG